MPPIHTLKLYKKADKGIYTELYTISKGKHFSPWEVNKEEYFGKLNGFLQNSKVLGKESQEINVQERE